MAVAIVHYHLLRGGVTRVIEAQSEALRAAGIEHRILSGTAYEGPADLPVTIVPELGYTAAGVAPRPGTLGPLVRTACRRELGGEPDLWHIHNPTLGKNIDFPDLVRDLATAQARLALQFHDFAEDGRPGNYRQLASDELYPVGSGIRYIFINSRDKALLEAAGIPAALTSLLPNAVRAPDGVPGDLPDLESPRVLYPVRGIRRKNVGEFCLLAALSPPGIEFALTLEPENPQWRARFEEWRSHSTRLGLPARLGVVGKDAPAPGREPTYENWLAHSSHLVTTSIAEGFGLAFLEPLALGKPLFGRNLSEITIDFRKDGLELGALYERLLVPSAWVDAHVLRERLRDDLTASYSSYQRPLTDQHVAEAWHSLTDGAHFDFGNLPEENQHKILERAMGSPGDLLISEEGSRCALGDWLARALNTPPSRPPSNDLAHYSLSNYRQRLQALYDGLASEKPDTPHWLDKARVLDQFLKPARFHFLRT